MATGLGMGFAGIALLTPQAVQACGDYTTLHFKSLEQWAQEAVSENPALAARAIGHLRALGQPGLDALFRVHAQDIAQLEAPTGLGSSATSQDRSPNKETTASRARLKAAIEGVSMQRNCEASKLYWYTDLEQAKAAAVAAGNKPILSLRLLGKLNEEYSCANSRFFRTTLYANAEVSAYLRDHFILHWESVRPVPRITVDFGDGRRIERTITGNSIHYILDSNGRVVDALPGLYGARAFLAGLQKAEGVASQTGGMDEAARLTLLRAYHRSSEAQIETAFVRDLRLIQPETSGSLPGSLQSYQFAKTGPGASAAPSAREAATRAYAKSAIESPLLRPGGSRPGAAPGVRPGSERIENKIGDEMWQKLAALHAGDATLDLGSRILIRAKSADAAKAATLAAGKRLVEDPLLRSLRNLERSIAEDTVRNEYTMHTRIHEWLAAEPSPELEKLNSRVYAELFLTPDSDPWLGLAPEDSYSALDNDGLLISADFGGRNEP